MGTSPALSKGGGREIARRVALPVAGACSNGHISETVLEPYVFLSKADLVSIQSFLKVG
jgi:hypothetical protein